MLISLIPSNFNYPTPLSSCRKMSSTWRPEHRAMLPFLLLFFIFYGVGAKPLLLQPSLPLPPPPPPPPPQHESVNINPMVALLIAFTASSLFFAIFITIYILDCTSPPSSPQLNLPVPKGLNLEVIGGFSTFVYSEVKEHKIGKGPLECAVCLCEFEDYETLRLIPKCDHVFHQECIDEWLTGHATCPVCRANLTPPSGDFVKGRTDCSRPEEEHHVEIDIDEEATVASEEVIQRKNEVGVAKQSNRDLGSESHSGKTPRWLGRSHSTGHSLVRPRVDTNLFTLRLPEELRKQIMERPLTPYFPGEGSSRRVIRSGDGSNRGRFLRRLDRLDRLDRPAKSERWISSKTPLFLAAAEVAQGH